MKSILLRSRGYWIKLGWKKLDGMHACVQGKEQGRAGRARAVDGGKSGHKEDLAPPKLGFWSARINGTEIVLKLCYDGQTDNEILDMHSYVGIPTKAEAYLLSFQK